MSDYGINFFLCFPEHLGVLNNRQDEVFYCRGGLKERCEPFGIYLSGSGLRC